MLYTIYQGINNDPSQMLKLLLGQVVKEDLVSFNYIPVYTGNVDASDDLQALEDLFMIFNVAHPAGYRGRSLSSGDVVELGVNCYICKPVGWQLL
jgi:hypothetical protein